MAKSNPIASKLILIIFAVVVVLIVLILKNKKNHAEINPNEIINVETVSVIEDVPNAPELTAENTQFNEEAIEQIEVELGVEGDTTNDTIRTLTAKLSGVEKQIVQIKSQQSEDDSNDSSSIKTKDVVTLKRKLEDGLLRISNLEKNLQEQKKRLEEERQQVNSSDFNESFEFPISTEKNGPKIGGITSLIPNLRSSSKTEKKEEPEFKTHDEIIWVEPMDSVTNTDGEGNETTIIPKINDLIGRKKNNDSNVISSITESSVKPYATIPRGSTAIDTISLTALIGRIPVGGQIVDAFKFKVLLSKENLASNGIVIDGIDSAVVGGRVSGDYALSCVKGTIDYITFTFQDGTISSYPEMDIAEITEEDSLGYISDNAGIPCIAGLFITNGGTYLAQQMGLTSLRVGAEAYADSQVTTVASGDTINSAVDGNRDNYVLGRVGSESIEDATDWLSERQQNSFDAVYLPPATKMSIHFEKEIPIDYNQNGRRTNYGSQNTLFNNTNNYSGLY